MLRKEWAFEYAGGKLADAAVVKMNFHGERLEWWKSKKADVMAKIRSEGLEVDEKMALGYFYDCFGQRSHRSGPTPAAVIGSGGGATSRVGMERSNRHMKVSAMLRILHEDG